MLKFIKTLITKFAESYGYYVGILPPTADSVESHVAMLCDNLGINCIFDVGAHYGEYALRMRKAGYTGRIVSFEPILESYIKLKEVSDMDDNWHIYHVALGDSISKKQMNVTGNTEVASLLAPSKKGEQLLGSKIKVEREEEVSVVTLDSVYDECIKGINKPKCYLKVDAQGYDKFVFEGSQGKLSEFYGLQTEMSVQSIYEGVPDYKENIEYLIKKGFLLSGIFPVRVDASMRLVEIDCIMVQ